MAEFLVIESGYSGKGGKRYIDKRPAPTMVSMSIVSSFKKV